MLVLLPPSEGKTAPRSGPPLDLGALSLPSLTPAREQVLDDLVTLARGDREAARAVLGLSPGLADEIDRDAALGTAPTAPARRVYTGVLFAALNPAGADRRTRTRLTRWVLVWSALWGAVRLDDPIPAYRLSGAVTLPGPGRLSAFWRAPLAEALDPLADGQLVFDLRSATYASSWPGPPGTTVTGRVIHEHGGQRTVASHFNKATKGRVVRALAESDAQPRTPSDLLEAVRACGIRAELSTVQRGGARAHPTHLLDLVVPTLSDPAPPTPRPQLRFSPRCSNPPFIRENRAHPGESRDGPGPWAVGRGRGGDPDHERCGHRA